jgi:hypothetical protein
VPSWYGRSQTATHAMEWNPALVPKACMQVLPEGTMQTDCSESNFQYRSTQHGRLGNLTSGKLLVHLFTKSHTSLTPPEKVPPHTFFRTQRKEQSPSQINRSCLVLQLSADPEGKNKCLRILKFNVLFYWHAPELRQSFFCLSVHLSFQSTVPTLVV